MRAALSTDAMKTFIATRGSDPCVALYPMDEWQDLERQLLALPRFSPQVAALKRAFTMYAEDVKLDSQGRVVLPKHLVEYAGLQEEALICGALDHIQIWDPLEWEKHSANKPNLEALAAEVLGG